MSQEEPTLLDQWLTDTTFINWAQNLKGNDYNQWESWLSENPEKRPLAEIGRQMIKGIPFRPIPTRNDEDQKYLEDLWDEIHQREQAVGESGRVINWRRPFHNKLVQFAAAAVILICGAITFLYLNEYTEEVLKETAYGEKMTFVLPDKSEVILNANSSLRYDSSKPRKVWLEGEAFFKVSKNQVKQEKFQVITPDLTIEVMGTAFNVNSHQEKTKVYLEEGTVKLNLKSETIPEIVLLPGEILTYSRKEGAEFEKKRTETKLESSWKAGTQLFEKTPLLEILSKMEEIYGVKIQLREHGLSKRLITMGIPVEDLGIALATIENVLKIKIMQVDKIHYYIE